MKFDKKKRSSPVHHAVERDDVEILNLLFESGGKDFLDQLDYVRRTPLMCAVDEGASSAAETIVAAGADLESLDMSYVPRTALGVAIENKNYNMAKWLLASGANPDEGSYNKAKRMVRSPEFLELIARYRKR